MTVRKGWPGPHFAQDETMVQTGEATHPAVHPKTEPTPPGHAAEDHSSQEIQECGTFNYDFKSTPLAECSLHTKRNGKLRAFLLDVG